RRREPRLDRRWQLRASMWQAHDERLVALRDREPCSRCSRWRAFHPDILRERLMSVTRQLWFETALLPEGWARGVRIAITNGRITGITRETTHDAAAGDERHAIGLPGLLNVHSHAFQRAMAGLAERRSPGNDSFWTWRETMYRFVERLDPDDIEAVAAQ